MVVEPCRRRLLRHVAALPMLWVAGCSRWTGPQVITLDEAELVSLVSRSFPQTRRVLEVLDVELSVPRLRLLPEVNRLALVVWLRTCERLLGSSGHGQLAFDCALRYAPQDTSLRLTQVRVQQLRFERGPGPAQPAPDPPRAAGPTGAGGGDSSAYPRLGPALAERVLEDLAVYRLDAARLARLREAGLQPGAVTVTSRGVEITLLRTGV